MQRLSAVRIWLLSGLFFGSLGSAPFASAADEGLSPASGCTQLKHYLVETAQQGALLKQNYGIVALPMDQSSVVGEVDFSAMPDTASPTYSGTNVQEAGVDEPDVVKTDGNYLYLISGNRLITLKSWPAGETAEVSLLDLEDYPIGLFIKDDIAVVLSSVWSYGGDAMTLMPVTNAVTRVQLYDIKDRSAPTLMRQLDIEGNYATARLVDGYLHLVVGSYLPVYDYPVVTSAVLNMPGAEVAETQALAARLTVRRYAKKLARMGLEKLVPRYEDSKFAAEGAMTTTVSPISQCDDFYLPAEPVGTSTISVVTLNLNDPLGEPKTATVVGDNGEVYASADNLYVVSLNAGAWYWLDGAAPQDTSTIYKFKLGAAPQYVASGKVPGWIVNRYALSESVAEGEAVLRIATTSDMWGWQPEGPRNRLYTLTQSDDHLDVLATLEGLGHEGERIYSVRYDGDRGYVVTFRQTDPLYTLDLSDPAAPKVAGELEIPGFSTYLHPTGDGYLLAVGQNTEQGGTDVSLFDVRDPAAPTLVDREWLGQNSWSEAMYEPKAFTYFAPLHQLALPVQQWSWSEDGTSEPPFTGAKVFDVDPAAGLTLLAEVDHADLIDNSNSWWGAAPIRRTIYIGEDAGYALFTISDVGVKANDALSWADMASLRLPDSDWGPVMYDSVGATNNWN